MWIILNESRYIIIIIAEHYVAGQFDVLNYKVAVGRENSSLVFAQLAGHLQTTACETLCKIIVFYCKYVVL